MGAFALRSYIRQCRGAEEILASPLPTMQACLLKSWRASCSENGVVLVQAAGGHEQPARIECYGTRSVAAVTVRASAPRHLKGSNLNPLPEDPHDCARTPADRVEDTCWFPVPLEAARPLREDLELQQQFIRMERWWFSQDEVRDLVRIPELDLARHRQEVPTGLVRLGLKHLPRSRFRDDVARHYRPPSLQGHRTGRYGGVRLLSQPVAAVSRRCCTARSMSKSGLQISASVNGQVLG